MVSPKPAGPPSKCSKVKKLIKEKIQHQLLENIQHHLYNNHFWDKNGVHPKGRKDRSTVLVCLPKSLAPSEPTVFQLSSRTLRLVCPVRACIICSIPAASILQLRSCSSRRVLLSLMADAGYGKKGAFLFKHYCHGFQQGGGYSTLN